MKKSKNELQFPENLCADIKNRTSLSRQIPPGAITDALEQLNRSFPDLNNILVLLYSEHKTLAQVGEIYGVTAERIRQKRNIALWKLRRIIYPSASKL